MKMKFTMLFLTAMFAVAAFAQKPEAIVVKADVPPVIDGIEDEVWADANTYDIDKPFRAEVTSLGDLGETTWKALWDDDGIYVLLTVADDVFYPFWAVDPPGTNWQFDVAEIYFDVNFLHEDGIGPTSGDAGNAGHYQFTPNFAADAINGELTENDGWQNANLVNDPDYVVEFFVPFEKLLDENGIGVDKLEPIGFDVYIIDNDIVPEGSQQRAVWANIGGTDQAWANMDDCGTITLEGAEAGTYVEEIQLEDAVIDENNGMVQIMATVLPEDATDKGLSWTLENGTGRATIDKDGVVTAIADGTVSITAVAKDGSWSEAFCSVTISNQIVSMHELNVIRNGYFNDGTDEWNTWGTPEVIDGVFTVLPDVGVNVWDFRLQQQGSWGLNTEDMYTLSFVLWADDNDTLNVNFEDSRGDVDYNRYGVSSSELSANGDSEWTIVTETEATKYTVDIQFTELLPESNEMLHFMLGTFEPMFYLDSVVLINDKDLELISDDYTEVESITVSGASSVAVDGTAQMTEEVLPADALLTGVRWSVVNGTGEATIDETGMLTGVTEGTVTVVASAKDDSQVTGVMDVTVGVTGISRTSVESLKVYPNPAINELNVVLNYENTRVSIYNGVGQKMEELVVSGTEYRFDISNYAAGIYFVKTETAIAKFVK